jgi:ABC-type transporter Mla MlaB component
MREPIAAPKITKYSDVDSTGATMLCTRVRRMRAISNAAPKITKYSDVDSTGATMLCTTVRRILAISNR